jgi:D-beta-D-heptose 7-phosphate kinase/D-beta-D-heptose 1-phosphate adenosyltransferase
VSQAEAAAIARRERRRGRVVVFTNGCFDILHVGHLSLLERSRAMGDTLVVGVNTDPSVRRLKGPGRPIVPLPARLIERLVPDVLIKGRDYRRETIVGRATVEEAGGKVITLPLLRTLSTSNLVRRALRSGRRALRRAR